jgi:hypothetical protein
VEIFLFFLHLNFNRGRSVPFTSTLVSDFNGKE